MQDPQLEAHIHQAFLVLAPLDHAQHLAYALQLAWIQMIQVESHPEKTQRRQHLERHQGRRHGVGCLARPRGSAI